MLVLAFLLKDGENIVLWRKYRVPTKTKILTSALRKDNMFILYRNKDKSGKGSRMDALMKESEHTRSVPNIPGLFLTFLVHSIISSL